MVEKRHELKGTVMSRLRKPYPGNTWTKRLLYRVLPTRPKRQKAIVRLLIPKTVLPVQCVRMILSKAKISASCLAITNFTLNV